MEHSYTTDTPSKRPKKRFKLNKICSVPQCSKRASKYSGVSLHLFPTEKKMRCKWIAIFKMGKVPKNAYAYSQHFTENDFLLSLKGNGRLRRLKKEALPSLHLPKSSIAPSNSAERKSFKRKEDRNARLAKRKLEFEVKHRNLSIPETNPANDSDLPIPETNPANDSDLPIPETIDHQNQCDQCVQVDVTFQIHKPFTILEMLRSDTQVVAFTGLESITSFRRLCDTMELLEPKMSSGVNMELGVSARVLLTLLKLKTNTSFRCLAAFFNVSLQTASNYFYKTLHILSLFMKHLIPWPKREEIRKNLPIHFDKFLKTRIVLDCTEFPVACCRCLTCRVRCYSHYKGTHTLKVLLGVTPGGLLSFISEVYGGRASDKTIFLQTSLLEKLEVGDCIMVDKGFLIQEECKQYGVQVIQPPFLKNGRFSPQDAEHTYDVAQARVHVERYIQRIKTYKILKDKVAWHLVPHFNEILIVVCGVVNLLHPILADNKFKKK